MIRFNSRLFHDLSQTAQQKINDVLANGGTRTARPSGEVSAVKSITLDGFDQIARAWSPLLAAHSHRIRLQAVFCHSRPQVTFPHPLVAGTQPRRCELADLLVVIDHKPGANAPALDRRAVLVQAKLLKGGQIVLGTREKKQHDLLCGLPSFQFVEQIYDRRIRDLRAASTVGDPDYTSEYGGIDLAGPMWKNLLPHAPYSFHSPIDFGQYLAAMVFGQPKCSREAAPQGTDDWSYTIRELLRVTACRPIVKRMPKVLRGNDNIVGFLVDTAPDFVSTFTGGSRRPPREPEDGIAEEWPTGPISVARLVISEGG